jgi:hypothetical protein
MFDDLAEASAFWFGHSAFLNRALNPAEPFAFAASYTAYQFQQAPAPATRTF